MQPRSAVALALAVAAACGRSAGTPPVAARPDQEARLIAVDVFDTDPGSVEQVVARHGDALRALLRDPADAHVRAVTEAIRAGGGYAYVEPSTVTYYEPQGRISYLTIDLVDQRDAAQRLRFSPPPTGTYADPGGLIATQGAYEAAAFSLLSRGKLLPPPADCPSFHCFGDPRQPELRSLAAELAAGVPAHVDELATILRDDSRPDYRGAAAFLLAYAREGGTVVAALVPALRDARSLVRNNAMRVLAEIALHHPELDVPVAPIIEALGYPATSDRNKAAATLHRLLSRPGAAALHPRVARDCGPILLAMLRLQQPNNHDYAYKILKTISGRTYADRDYAAWQTWLAQAAAD